MTEGFRLIALVFFPLAVLYAGIGDLLTLKIPNRVVLALLIGYVVLAPFAGFSTAQLVLSLLAATAVFALAFGAFACGWMGGGDVKLLTVAALWLGLPQLSAFLLYTSLCGGVLTFAVLACRFLPAGFAQIGWIGRLNGDQMRVPYGVAIAAASLIVFTATPWVVPLH